MRKNMDQKNSEYVHFSRSEVERRSYDPQQEWRKLAENIIAGRKMQNHKRLIRIFRSLIL